MSDVHMVMIFSYAVAALKESGKTDEEIYGFLDVALRVHKIAPGNEHVRAATEALTNLASDVMTGEEGG